MMMRNGMKPSVWKVLGASSMLAAVKQVLGTQHTSNSRVSALQNRAGHLRKGAAALPSSANAVKAHCTCQTSQWG